MAMPVSTHESGSASASASADAAPQPKIDQMMGMTRASSAMMLFTEAKMKYTQVMEKLEAEGFTHAMSDENQRTREEYARVVQHPLMQEMHSEIAKKALQIARINGGIYNKAAQFVASLQAGAGDTGIPKQYVEELRACTDQCPPKPLSAFVEMIREDLGGSVEDLFETFEEKPIGAASLAQVHRAVTKGGKVVAIKLQYPGLSDQLASDFFVFKTMSAMLQSWAMGIDLNVLLKEFESTVRRELNFLDEAQNGETTRQALRHLHPSVYVPATVPELCSKRILAMEYVDGMVKLNPAKLEEAKLSPPRVTELVNDTFAHMACCQGRVHGDPHAGNVYARQMPGASVGTAQLVLLDHGLIHMLDEEMRVDICEMFLACSSRRGSEMSRLGEKFAGPLGRFFPLVLSPWFIFGSQVGLADVRAAYRRQLPPDVSLKDVGETLAKLYGRGGLAIGLLHSLGYTRGLLNDLGCSERQRVTSLARAARLGLEDEVYRTGAADVRGELPALGAALREVQIVLPRLSVRAGMMWAAFQVRVTSTLLNILWPVASWMEPRPGAKRKMGDGLEGENKKQKAEAERKDQ